MWASKCYAVEIIQCVARSDIYEGRYDFYLGCVLCVWIWSVPRDQEPIYQPDSWRFVRWGTSAIPCSHSKTLNIYWDWYWQSREMHQLRIKEVDDNEVWFQTLSSGHPEATCFHRLNGESRKSTNFLPPNFLLLPLPRQSPTQLNCRICVCLVSFNSRDFPVCHLRFWHSNSERAKFFSHFLLHLAVLWLG